LLGKGQEPGRAGGEARGGGRVGALTSMPKASKVFAYTRDALLIFVPLGVVLYFIFDPEAFNAFLAWIAKVL
jgi:hypothetical protein